MVSQFLQKDYLRISLLVAGVFLSRLPFLFAGYGLDGDSWAVAIAAENWLDTGYYEASRLPGYPVHELLARWGVSSGPFCLNLISAVFSAIAVFYFTLTLKALRFRAVYLAAVAFAAVPVFYIHSTTTIDYVIALGFIMMALYAVTRERMLLAGIAMGLAIGCRLTSGAMLIPLSILLLRQDGWVNNVRRTMQFNLPALLVGLICFIPVLRTYRTEFFTYYDVPYPSILKVLYKFSIEVWGLAGLAGLGISLLLFFLPAGKSARNYLFPRSVNERHVVAWLVAIDLYIIAFLKLPMESGYLIPIIPFVIMLFGKYLYQKAFTFFCVMLILSPFVASIAPAERLDAGTPSGWNYTFGAGEEKLTLDVLKGPVIAYNSRRENGVDFVNELLNSFDTIQKPSVLVAGRWYNQLLVQGESDIQGKMTIRSYLNEEEAVHFFSKGAEIYFMPRQDFYNQAMRKVDLHVYEAKPYLDAKSF